MIDISYGEIVTVVDKNGKDIFTGSAEDTVEWILDERHLLVVW